VYDREGTIERTWSGFYGFFGFYRFYGFPWFSRCLWL
jgi:hypothetical protein